MNKKTMKMITLLTALFVFTVTTLSNIVDAQFLPMKLKVTVIDKLGNIVEDANVKSYKSKKDYIVSERIIGSLVTNEKGQAIFKNPKPTAYFIEVEKGDMSNKGYGVKTSILSEGKINKVHIVIEWQD